MVKILSTDLKFPDSAEKNIIEMFIRMKNGVVTFNSGLQCEILPTHGHFLRGYKFDPHTQIIADGNPGIDWLWTFPTTFDTLANVKKMIFNGSYADDLITGFVSRLKLIEILALTYINAPSFTSIVYNIVSPHLRELTCHVIGTGSTMEESFTSLRDLGRRFGDEIQLENLMLIYGEGYDGRDIAVEADSVFGNALHLHAVVLLLFSHEISCMTGLRAMGYTDAGKITMAKNNPELRETDEKMVFETYFLFKKSIGQRSYMIGCRKAPKEVAVFSTPPNDSSIFATRLFDHLDIEDFDIDAENQAHTEPAFLKNGKYGDFENEVDRNYDAQLYPPGSDKKCCNCKKFSNLEEQNYHFPGWDNVSCRTRIIKVLLYLHDTRYVLSNGLIFKLQQMCDEWKFYKDFKGRASHRLTFVCTTQDRRYMELYGLMEFMINVQQVEFHGYFWTDVVDEIAKRLSDRCKIITMMRMKMDRKVSYYVIQRLLYRQNIKKYFFDGRDTNEYSLASIVNSIKNHKKPIFEKLTSLILMARTLNDPQYRSSWYQLVRNIVQFTAEDAEITIVVHEIPNKEALKFLSIDLYTDNYSHDVIVPVVFSSRHFHVRWSGRMRQFKKRIFNRRWNIIFPIPLPQRQRLHGVSSYDK